jgi:hypothetical protein
VGARQHLGRVAIGVERVFDDIVALGADEMQEQLAGEVRQAEARADHPAVDGHAGHGVGQRLFPRGQHAAFGIEQPRPVAHAAGAVADPVFGGCDPGVMAAAVAEEREVGREVQRVEIARAVGEHGGGQPHVVERRHRRARWQQVPDMREDALGIERRDQDHAGAAFADLAHRLHRAAEHRAAERLDLLHIDIGDLDAVERMDLGEARGKSVGIVHRDRPRRGEPRFQRLRGGNDERMRDGLEDADAAGLIAEGFDLERHRLAFAVRAVPGPRL